MAALDKSQYEEIVITSTDGSKSVDITVGVIMIDYYEDIFSPTITAKLRVVNEGFSITGDDGKLQSVYNGLPLRGGEKVRIKIKPNCPSNVGLDFSTKQESQLYVSKISSVIVDRNSESFVLHLVSREAISNETSRVGRKYPTSLKISDSVKKIVKDYLKTTKKIKSEETQNPYGFIGNMRKPFTVLMWLASKGVPSKGKKDATAGYLFYETKSGYMFKSLDGLISSKPFSTKYYYSELIDSQQSNDYRILEYNTNYSEDVLGKLQKGAYASQRTFFNPLTFDYTEQSRGKFGPKDYKGKTKTLGKDMSLPGNLASSPSRNVTAVLDIGTMEKEVSKKPNADPAKTQSQSMMRYNSIFSQSMSMTIPLNTNLEAGNIIECEFPLVSGFEGNNKDIEQSGLYMIKELCHHFDSTGSYTSLTLIKDTFGPNKK